MKAGEDELDNNLPNHAIPVNFIPVEEVSGIQEEKINKYNYITKR